MSDTQTYLQEAIAGTLARDAPMSLIREWLAALDLQPAHQVALRQGWTGIGTSEDLGGQGGGVQDLAVLAEQLGRAVMPWDRSLAGAMVAALLVNVSERGDDLIRRVSTGEATAVLCGDARTPAEALSDMSIREGRVTGAVAFVLGASDADVLLALCRRKGGDDVEILAVDREAEGVRVTPRRLVDLTRDLADVEFVDSPCRSLGVVPSSRLSRAMQLGTVLVCADSLGAASRMLEMTTSYVKDRRQFGVPVGSFQAVKHSAAQMLVDVEGMRSAVQFAAWAVDVDSDDADLHTSVAGAYCSSVAQAVADRALFLHGAIGYTWEHDLHLLFKRAYSAAALFGSADWHRGRVSDALEARST